MSDFLKMEFKYFQCPNDIFDIEKEELNVNEKIVYIYLCRCCNQGANAFPSFATIGKKTSTSEKTAERAIKKLIEKKLIIKTNRTKIDKKSKKLSKDSNLYDVIDSSNIDFKRHKNPKDSLNPVKSNDLEGYRQRDGRGTVRETEGVPSERRIINNKYINNKYINNKQYTQEDNNVNTNFEKNKENFVVVKNQTSSTNNDLNLEENNKNKDNTNNKNITKELIQKVKSRYEKITQEKTTTTNIKELLQKTSENTINTYLDNIDNFEIKRTRAGFIRDAILGGWTWSEKKVNKKQTKKQEQDPYYKDLNLDEENPTEVKL